MWRIRVPAIGDRELGEMSEHSAAQNVLFPPIFFERLQENLRIWACVFYHFPHLSHLTWLSDAVIDPVSLYLYLFWEPRVHLQSHCTPGGTLSAGCPRQYWNQTLWSPLSDVCARGNPWAPRAGPWTLVVTKNIHRWDSDDAHLQGNIRKIFKALKIYNKKKC